MLIRLLHGVGVAVLLGGLIWLLADRAAPVQGRAADLRGDRWYRLMLDDRHIGYLHTRGVRDALGRWHFESDLTFALGDGKRVQNRELLVFGALPPYPLLRAEARSRRGDGEHGTIIDRAHGGYRVARVDGGGFASPPRTTPPETRPLELAFTLGDYLGFEAWLQEAEPNPGATVSARSLDFSRRRVVSRQFRVVERNHTGYLVENEAPLEPTRIQLDEKLRPVRMTLSGLFELERTSRAEAFATRTGELSSPASEAPLPAALPATGYFVPADRALYNHTEIRALELEVEGDVAASELWPTLSDGNALHRVADSVTIPHLVGDELAETADHPVTDPRIHALAERAVGGITDPTRRVAALTHFVNDFIRYADDGIRRPVLDLLEQPEGDCSEYADLLTTLARALGIPSRTIFGLAYASEGPPAFRFHAWNELLVDGEWHAVDPTWNQLRIDATHIPMPSNVAHTLGLLTGGLDLRFTIQSVEYF